MPRTVLHVIEDIEKNAEELRELLKTRSGENSFMQIMETRTAASQIDLSVARLRRTWGKVKPSPSVRQYKPRKKPSRNRTLNSSRRRKQKTRVRQTP